MQHEMIVKFHEGYNSVSFGDLEFGQILHSRPIFSNAISEETNNLHREQNPC